MMIRRRTGTLVSAALLVLPMATADLVAARATTPAPATLKVTGDVRTPLSISPDELKAMPRKRVEVKDDDGRTVAYEGVLVGEILERAGATLGSDMRGNALTTYVVASATDGYQVVFSLAELDPAFTAETPPIPYDAVSLPLMPAGHTIGETEGVAINSKKHLFVYTRSGNVGPARGSQAAELFEFDEKNNFVKEWGQNAYGFSFAHAVRIDKDDNVWVVDEGSNMVMKFSPQGLVTMVHGRKDEAIDYLEEFLEDAAHTERTQRSTPGPAPGGAARSAVRPT